MSTAQLYANVTNAIIADLEVGAIPWTKPWKNSATNGTGILPSNAVTGRSYKGVNVVILLGQARRQGIHRQSLAYLQTGTSIRRPGAQGRAFHGDSLHQEAQDHRPRHA
jgi:antirestriction protein ArdC